MLFRSSEGNLVKIVKHDFLTDTMYYKKILSIIQSQSPKLNSSKQKSPITL